MSAEVDIKHLAVVRGEEAPVRVRRRHVVSRYVIPGLLLAGFTALLLWALRNVLVPPRDVWVVPV
jgi:HlyD family secretion protein